jgi:hypothetical protein
VRIELGACPLRDQPRQDRTPLHQDVGKSS